MASFLLSQPHPLILSPITQRTRPSNPLYPQTHSFFKKKSNLRIGDSVMVRFHPSPSFQNPEIAEGLIKELLGKAEGALYMIADAAISSDSKQSGDWLSGITNYLESVLKVLKDGLSALHIPYSYGFAIILLTVLVKAVTFPLSKKQVESAMAMRSLQPQIKAIQQLYAGDQERIQLETARLYKLAGVNPLAGCLPTLATIPIWIGLYRALSNVADEGLLTEGFFWIPSLSGPTTIAARQNGSGISWLFPFIDGHPPLGWPDTWAYLVLPVLLVVSQYISIQIMQSSQGNDPSQKSSQALTKFLPLMIGYFSLSVPSGLSLYWFTNNILSTAQQIWLQKLGGAKNPVRLYSDETIREEQPKIHKPNLEVVSNQIQPSGDKPASGGLRPGERFKQIKEREAMRRKQLEEDKRKAEEAAKGADIVNKEHEGVTIVNGGNFTQGSEDGQTKIVLPEMANGGLTSNSGIVMNVEHEILTKEETVETYSTNNDNGSAKHASLDRREQASQRDEA
ncbi:ALBINO3-like protein 1, chloroplastic [Tasmannia lanceolata]|uniref:ALBINO3-like protein 1, chloroplastic n=1 Tax=Tasmannia lanceolata TaxID=3420 RepID=UPI0040640962